MTNVVDPVIVYAVLSMEGVLFKSLIEPIAFINSGNASVVVDGAFAGIVAGPNLK
jgi:hypothetical protein